MEEKPTTQESTDNQAALSQPEVSQPNTSNQNKPPIYKNKKLIAGVIVLLLVAAGGASYALTRPKDKNTNDSHSPTQHNAPEAKQASFEPNPIDCKPFDENQWYRTDSTFVVDPKNPDTMYVNVEWKGFYKSTDGGKTWAKKVKGIVTDSINKDTKEPCYTEYPVAVIDPTNPNRLLLATSGGGGGTINDLNMRGGGVYESTNGGDSWKQKINDKMNGYVTHALVLDPKNPQTFYYGTAASPASYREADPNKIWVSKGVIYKTADNGKKWEELPTGIIKNLRLIFIAVDSQDTNKLTASGVVMIHNANEPNGISDQQIGIIQSLDGGKSWKRIDNLPKGYEATQMGAASPKNGNNMFNIAAVVGGQQTPKSFYSTDSGHVWKQASTNLDFVAYDPRDTTGKHLVGYKWQCSDGPCSKSLLQSHDAGATWSPFGTLPKEITSLQDQKTMPSKIVWSPNDTKTFYLTGANGYVWKTTDNGQTWATLLSLDKLK